MNKKLPECPTELLNRFLDESIDAETARQIEHHLGCCEDCQAALRLTAGESELWNNINEYSDDKLDLDFSNDGRIASEDRDSDCLPDDGKQVRLKAVFNSIRHLFAPTDNPQSVGKIGNYDVFGMIGCGGMGVVLKAKDSSLDRTVAIKMLAPHLATHETSRIRFQREAKAAAAIRHPAIIPIYGVSIHRDIPYFVMPYESGPSLQRRIESEGPLTIEESLRVGLQIAEALSAAHQSGLVHRDIKPSNILLAPGTERALLTDFGLVQVAAEATITQTGLVSGTPAFMSPEQARGEPVDSRSDLFSLGSVLFMMLTSQPPVSAESAYAVVRQLGGEPVPRVTELAPELPEWLDQLVGMFHQSEPDKRINTAIQATEILGDCLAHLQNPSEKALPFKSANPLDRVSEWTRFRLQSVFSAAVAFVVVSLTYFGMHGNLTTPTKDQPERGNSAITQSGESGGEESPNEKSQTSSRPQDQETYPKSRSSMLASKEETAVWTDVDEALEDIRERMQRLNSGEQIKR